EAVKLVHTLTFDFALVDHRLGGKETGADFWSYCKENKFIVAKNNGSSDRMKIIVYSSGIESTPAGMTYLEKPIDMKVLKREIERIVGK
ncbi:unnamed protein product, partial [marine sediment metagenome]